MMNFMKKKYGLLCLAVTCGLLFSACGQGKESQQEMSITARGVVEGIKKTALIRGVYRAGDIDEILALLIEDEGFRRCVRYGADLEEGDAPETVLHKLEICESLVLRQTAYYDKAIYSLESLTLLPNLKQLVVKINEWDDSDIADFTPIAQLSGLESLYISYEKEESIDLSFLGEMHTVTELFVTHCNLEDSSFLGQMPQLQRLSLYETPVEDLAVLEKLPELVELSLYGNENAKHIEAVGTLTKMQDLGLQYCGIEDIGFLRGLTELRGVNLNGNSISDITPLSELRKLERLGLSENGIRDIEALGGLSNLFDLALDGNEIQDISVLAGLSNLSQVGLSDNQIVDFSPLAGKEELMYAAVFGNPMESIEPVWEVPMLLYTDKGVSDEEAVFIAGWLEEHYPEAEEFECIDFIQGDLNGDGRQDVAFVVDSAAFDVYEGEDFSERMPDDRRMFILLQQTNGSWKELKDVPSLANSTSGGLRGDPYHGAYMEAGHLLIKTGWGSSSGSVETKIYEYRGGSLCLTKHLSVSDYNYAEGYDVYMQNMQDDTWERYVIAMDGYRMVRVNLEDSEHPRHKAFPGISLFDRSYYIYREKIESQITSSEALDRVCAELSEDAVMEELPYTDWQKEGYELLVGVTLPDYYYVLRGTEREANGESKGWEGDYLYYDGLTVKDGERFHVIYLEPVKGEKIFLLNDATGEIEEME